MPDAPLTDFLALVTDPDVFLTYEADPDRFMTENRVPALARAAVLTGMTEWIEHLAIAEVRALKEDRAAAPSRPGKSGRGLTIVGTGIAIGQLTAEALAHIARAPKLLYAPADPVTERCLLRLNPNAESLAVHYRDGAPRRAAYDAMVDRIIAVLVDYGEVCVAFYGHPGLFVFASHAALSRARAEGWPARMLPAVSSLDCLFADLGVDPAHGCLVLEADEMVRGHRRPIPDLNLVLLQIASVGEPNAVSAGVRGEKLPMLVALLTEVYPASHPAIVYEAATLAVCAPRLVETTIGELARTPVSDRSTLYVPAIGTAA